MLYLGDCKDLISTLDKGSVDLMVTDPPYDHPSCKGAGFLGGRQSFKDITPISGGFDYGILDDCVKALKKVNIYIWGNWKAVLSYLDYFKGYNTTLLSWHKTNPIPTCSNKYLPDTEYCLYVREQGVKLYGGYQDHGTYWTTPMNTADSERYGHPTVKPLNIIRTMVRNSCGGGERLQIPSWERGQRAFRPSWRDAGSQGARSTADISPLPGNAQNWRRPADMNGSEPF